MKKNEEVIASGVDDLIRRLRQEGVEAAERESEQIIAAARQQAETLLQTARTESEHLLQQSRARIEQEQRAAEEALTQAYRDLILDMKTQLLTRVADNVAGLVGECLDRPDILEKMVLELVGRMAEDAPIADAATVDVMLPRQVMGVDDIRRNPDSANSGPMAEFTRQLMGKILREGVTFSASTVEQHGIQIKLVDRQMEIDVTDRAIAELLLRYLHPRFRALLDGIIR